MVDRTLKLKVLERFKFQADLAQAIGLREERLSRIINKRVAPNENEKRLIAKALRARPDELFPGS